MKSRKQLENSYEDALFDLLMDELMEFEGELLHHENVRLSQTHFEVPEETDRHCKQTITAAFHKRKKLAKAHRIRTICKTGFIAAIVCCFLFTTVYSIVPAVRVATLNLILELTDTEARFSMHEDTSHTIQTATTTPKYQLEYLPDGFVFSDSGSDDFTMWECYTSENGRIDFAAVCGGPSMVYGIDLEDCVYENVSIHAFSGLLTQKGDRVQIAWFDHSTNVVIDIVCNGLSKEEVLEIAQGVQLMK